MSVELIRDNLPVAEVEEQLQFMIDATPTAITIYNQDGHPISCNKEVLKMFGAPCKESFINNFSSIMLPNQPDGQISDTLLRTHILQAFHEGYANINEMAFIKPDGHLALMEMTFIRILNENEDIVIEYCRDITDKKRTLEAEREEAIMARVQLMFDATPLCIEYWDKDLKPLYCNQTVLDYYEVNKEEYTEKMLDLSATHKVLNEDSSSWSSWDKELRKIFETGTGSFEYVEQELPTEGPTYVKVEGRRMKFDGEDVVVTYSQDITTLKKNEQVIAQAQATIAETNRQLEEALAQALSASRAKSNFLSAMSHEMRTPMNAIIGMTAIAKKAETPAGKNDAMDKVQKAAHHLLGIINDVLDMSRIEANKLELRYTEMDIRSIVQNVISLVEPAVVEKNHHFHVKLHEDVPFQLIGDSQRLTQILTNLLTNAAVYTPDGGYISLDVSFVGEVNGVSELRFEVADNGIGIPPEQYERLFEAFERVDNSTSRKYGGTGLGLPISKRLTELMGGNIYIESEVGKGSKFIFTAKLAISAASPLHDADNNHDSDENNDFTGKNLLIAEDVEINAEILIELLDGTGLIIDVAKNGREAVAKVTANPERYDLVFMDMQMPEMDGLEATRRIRAWSNELTEMLPIIAMTANVFVDDIENCLEAGMNDHIGKPLDMAIVFEKLRKYL